SKSSSSSSSRSNRRGRLGAVAAPGAPPPHLSGGGHARTSGRRGLLTAGLRCKRRFTPPRSKRSAKAALCRAKSVGLPLASGSADDASRCSRDDRSGPDLREVTTPSSPRARARGFGIGLAGWVEVRRLARLYSLRLTRGESDANDLGAPLLGSLPP